MNDESAGNFFFFFSTGDSFARKDIHGGVGAKSHEEVGSIGGESQFGDVQSFGIGKEKEK